MSDEELIEKAKGAFGLLYAHRMMGPIDAIAALCERYATARAEADLLRGVVRDARSYLRSGESVSALSVLRNALDAETHRGHVDGNGDDPGDGSEGC